MKSVIINRFKQDSQATIGMLTISDLCHDPIYTLENPLRETAKDSCIPSGAYLCKPYSGTKYKGVYIVENVPNRSAILFHWGNTEKDTEGCLLLGNKLGQIGTMPAVLESKKCFARFKSIMGDSAFKLEIIESFVKRERLG